MGSMISRIQPATCDEWDLIWNSCDYATFFHSREWAEIWQEHTKSMIIPHPLLVAFNDGRRALFPFSRDHQPQGLYYRYLSSPAGTYGGWIAHDELTAGHVTDLAYQMLNCFKVSFWRLNPYDYLLEPLPKVGMQNDVTHTFDLSGGFAALEDNWSHVHKGACNKARRSGVDIRLAASAEDWSAYYIAYQDSILRWGPHVTSSYPASFFEIIRRRQSPHVKLWLAVYEGKVISGALCFYARRHVVNWHGATLTNYFPLRPVNLLAYEMIKDACSQGYRWFDMNPSGGHEGVRTFKERLGAMALPAPYVQRQALLVKGYVLGKNFFRRATRIFEMK